MKKYRLITLLTTVGVIGLCFIIYSNILHGEFVFDDRVHIIPDGEIKDLKEYAHLNNWLSIQSRPMSFFTFAINKHLHGLNEFGYHFFNIIIHLLSTLFVYLFIKELLKTKQIQLSNHIKFFPLIVALLFMVHPLQTQSVSYIIQRMTSLAGLFYLGSTYFYLKGRLLQINGFSRYGIILYVCCISFFIAALLSKQSAASLPFSLLLVELFFIRNRNNNICKSYVYIYTTILALLISIVLFGGYLPKETESISRITYLKTQFGVFVKYMQLMIFPYSLNLDYDWSLAVTLGIKEITGLIIIAGLIFISIKRYRKFRIISFAILWIFISLSIESTIIPIRDVIFEHRLYLPLMGFAIILAFSLFKLIKSKGILLGVFSIILLLFSFKTYSRNNVWKSNYNLWSDVVKKSPEKARPHKMIGNYYFQSRNMIKAEYHFNKSIELDKDDWQNYYNRATLYLYQNKAQPALTDINRSIKLKTDYADSYASRGMANLFLKNNKSAAKDFTDAINLAPEDHTYYINRAKAFMGLKEFQKSILDLERSFRINAKDGNAYYLRARCYFELKKYSFAYNDLMTAKRLGIKVDDQLIQRLKKKTDK